MGDAPSGASSSPLPSLPARLVQVVFSPGALSARLADEPRWLGAALVGAALIVLAGWLIPADLWADLIRRQMLAAGQPLPEGFDPGAMADMQRTVGLATGSVFWLLWILVAAGISALIFAFVLGDEGRYTQYLAVAAHAFVIPALGALLLVPLRLAQGDPTLTLNLGLFWPSDEGAVARMLRAQDLFMLWAWLVMAVGAHEIDQRRGVGSAAAVLLAVGMGIGALLALVTPG